MILPVIAVTLACFVGSPAEPLETKVYPIQDLLLVRQDYSNPPGLDLNEALNRGNNIFRGDMNTGNISPTRADPQGLIDIIHSYFGEEWSEDWKIIPWQGNLIVRAPKDIHERLQ